MGENVEINFKDISFRRVFEEKKGFIEMYKYFTGEDLKESEIEKFEVESNEFLDSVSYIKNEDNRIILLVHQSAQDVNIGIRIIMYYNELAKKYLIENRVVNGELPKIQLLIAYNGLQKEKDVTKKIGTEWIGFVANFKNINYSYIQEVDKFENLKTYSYYVEKIRKYSKDGVEEDKIKDTLIADCKKDNVPILSDILEGVIEMSTYYDIEQEFEEAKAEARTEARAEELDRFVQTLIDFKMNDVDDKIIEVFKRNQILTDDERHYVNAQIAKKSEEYK